MQVAIDAYVKKAAAITPHASNTFNATHGLTCSGAGTAAVRFASDSADVTVQLEAGVVYPYSVARMNIFRQSPGMDFVWADSLGNRIVAIRSVP